MDTTQQQGTQEQNTQTTQAPQSQQPVQQPMQVSQPVGTPLKEAEPIAVQEAGKAVEYIKPSEPEPELPEEVKDAGVQVVSHAPPVHEQIAVKASSEATPVVPSQNPLVKVMTREEMVSSQKLPPSSSARWLSALMLKIW